MPELAAPIDVLREILTWPAGTTADAYADHATEVLRTLEVWKLRAVQGCVVDLLITLQTAIEEKVAEQ